MGLTEVSIIILAVALAIGAALLPNLLKHGMADLEKPRMDQQKRELVRGLRMAVGIIGAAVLLTVLWRALKGIAERFG